MGKRERRKHKLDVHKEKKGYRNLKQEALDRTMWRTGFGRVCGPVLRHCGMNEMVKQTEI